MRLLVLGASFLFVAELRGNENGGNPFPYPPAKLAIAPLQHVVRLHARVLSGSQPETAEAFGRLRAMGVKSILSVDGARPDVAMAARFGIRYVHLPHGYDGISDARARELAKAVRDLPGPIYIHCHHGQHRSPAAAAVACVGCGLIRPSVALSVLHLAGTSENYRGLYRSAESAVRFDDHELDRMSVKFQATVAVPPLAESMVAVEHAHDRLKDFSRHAWKTDSRHPDLDPAHEALLLGEHFAEILRTDEVQRRPERFKTLTGQARTLSQDLETALRSWQRSGGKAPIPPSIGVAFHSLTQSCTTCHQAFRDVPLGEKPSRSRRD